MFHTPEDYWVMVSNSFYFHPYLGKIPILTHVFKWVETTNQIKTEPDNAPLEEKNRIVGCSFFQHQVLMVDFDRSIFCYQKWFEVPEKHPQVLRRHSLDRLDDPEAYIKYIS